MSLPSRPYGARNRSIAGSALLVLLAAGISTAHSLQNRETSASNPSIAANHSMPPGFLLPDQLPDSLALLPPPPARESTAFARDEAARREASAFRGGPRWRVAASDADLNFPHAPTAFSCAAGIAFSKERTPFSLALLSKSMIDVGLSTYGAKDHYKRIRPFVMHPSATCFPKDEPALRSDGSYPSGHSAVGWGWALILAELLPDRSNAILQRGHQFGESRIVCGVHWQSDVDAGRVVASATVARLHADAEFREAMDAARQELAAASNGSAPDAASCVTESKALAL